MAITDYLIGKSGIERQKEKAIDFARERYDPSVYGPQLEFARDLATEGIPQGQEDVARARTVESLFRPQDFSLYGGSQARAIAGGQAQNQQAQQALGEFEGRFTEAEVQAERQGRQAFAQTRTQQLQTQAQRDAAIEEAELQAEAEIQRRKQQLGTAALNIASTVATTPFGGGGSLVARGLSNLFGGEEMSVQPTRGIETIQPTGEIISDVPQPEDLQLQIEGFEGFQIPDQTPGQITEIPTLPEQQTPSFDELYDMRQFQQEQGFDYINALLTEGEQLPTVEEQQQGARLGERTFDEGEYMRRILGPVGESVYQFGTFPFRKGLNLFEEFSTQYGRALQQEPAQGIFE